MMEPFLFINLRSRLLSDQRYFTFNIKLSTCQTSVADEVIIHTHFLRSTVEHTVPAFGFVVCFVHCLSPTILNAEDTYICMSIA